VIELAVRIIFSLLVVLGLLWALARLSRRRVTGRGAGSLTVLARQQLGRNSSVAVVRVVDRAYVLGVTDTQISLIGDADLAALEAAAAPQERRDAVSVDAASLRNTGTPKMGSLNTGSLKIGPLKMGSLKTGSLKSTVSMKKPGMGGPVGKLDGSVLSPKTWRAFGEALRERTVRS
jgi:flagellar protein FliO/FliZ